MASPAISQQRLQTRESSSADDDHWIVYLQLRQQNSLRYENLVRAVDKKGVYRIQGKSPEKDNPINVKIILEIPLNNSGGKIWPSKSSIASTEIHQNSELLLIVASGQGKQQKNSFSLIHCL